MSKVISLRHVKAKLAALRLYQSAGVEDIDHRFNEAIGIDIDETIEVGGPICRCMATVFDDGSFAFDPFGEAGFGFVILDEDAETALDICAWSARDPSVFGVLLGQAGLIGALMSMDIVGRKLAKRFDMTFAMVRWVSFQNILKNRNDEVFLKRKR